MLMGVNVMTPEQVNVFGWAMLLLAVAVCIWVGGWLLLEGMQAKKGKPLITHGIQAAFAKQPGWFLIIYGLLAWMIGVLSGHFFL